jgi:hypothetical protein
MIKIMRSEVMSRKGSIMKIKYPTHPTKESTKIPFWKMKLNSSWDNE